MTRPFSLLTIFIVLPSMVCAAASAVDAGVVTGHAAAARFVQAGKPVHPFCVDFPAGSARWKPLTLSACTGPAESTMKDDGWHSADYPRVGGRSGGYVSYRVLASKDNRFLVATVSSGGGTGIFSALRWYRVSEGQVWISKEESGGDRCVGGLSGFEVKGRFVGFMRNVPAAAIIELSGAVVDPATRQRLNGSPVDCDGEVLYRYDPATEALQMTGLALNAAHGSAGSGWADPQACFDRLVGRSRKVLDPDELKQFGRAFASGCAPGTAKP